MGAYASAASSNCSHNHTQCGCRPNACSALNDGATLSSTSAHLLPETAIVQPLVSVLVWTGLVPEWRCLVADKNGFLINIQLPGEGLPLKSQCLDPATAAMFFFDITKMSDEVDALFVVGSVKFGESFAGRACEVSLSAEVAPGLIRPFGNFQQSKLKDGSGIILMAIFRSQAQKGQDGPKWWVRRLGNVYHLWDTVHPFKSLAAMMPNWMEQFCVPPSSKSHPPAPLPMGEPVELSRVHLAVAAAQNDLMMMQIASQKSDVVNLDVDTAHSSSTVVRKTVPLSGQMQNYLSGSQRPRSPLCQLKPI